MIYNILLPYISLQKRDIQTDKALTRKSQNQKEQWCKMVLMLGEEEQVVVQISDAGGKDPLG